jgi:hypothetical protein
MKKLFAAAVLSAMLAGCSIFGVPTPQSPSQAVAYAYGTVASVRNAAATALQSGTLTASQAQQVLTYTDDARAALDAGETVLLQNPSGDVSSYLTTASNLLTQAQALLPKSASAGSR